ncbi:MAG: hemerythrin domain-containing protein [Candidatus Brocadiia bacterium]
MPATEKLMREHGLIQRLMNVYQECADRLAVGEDLPDGLILNAGALADEFIESYHEEAEQKYVYPVFVEAGRMADLVAVMVRQHAIGRRLSEQTIYQAGQGEQAEPETRDSLMRTCWRYSRMYRAHVAFEDSILFPELRDVVSGEEFWQIASRIRAFEHETLGRGGLAQVGERVAEIEALLGLEGLDSFTPVRRERAE